MNSLLQNDATCIWSCIWLYTYIKAVTSTKPVIPIQKLFPLKINKNLRLKDFYDNVNSSNSIIL